ncbi:MAG: hypothetical protein ACLR2G_07955 [Phascolarctobacterium faecium]
MLRLKTLFGVDYTDKEWIKIILYLFVGGTAALVEWAFYGFNQGIGMEYVLATVCGVLSGNVSLFLGNILVLPAVPDTKKVKLSLVLPLVLLGACFNLI